MVDQVNGFDFDAQVDAALAQLSTVDEVETLQAALIRGLARVNERCAELVLTEQSRREALTMCKLCGEQPRQVAFAPCGHIACCNACALQVGQCPVCKQGIQRRVSVFLP